MKFIKRFAVVLLFLMSAMTSYAAYEQVYKVVPDTVTWKYDWVWVGKIGVSAGTDTINEYVAFMEHDGNMFASHLGLGTTFPVYPLEIIGSTTTAYHLAIGTSTAYQVVITTDGFIGIGTLAPTSTMTVAGNFQAEAGIFSGAVEAATLDTGQGANELFDMDQNVLTTSSPTYSSMTITNGGTFGKGITVNETGVDSDTRIEGSGEPNALFIDGSNGNVCIATDSVPAAIEFKVFGQAQITSLLYTPQIYPLAFGTDLNLNTQGGGPADSPAGDIIIQAGGADAGDRQSGKITVYGASTSEPLYHGNIDITGGSYNVPAGNQSGGMLNLYGGTAYDATGGNVDIYSGDSAVGGDSGDIRMRIPQGASGGYGDIHFMFEGSTVTTVSGTKYSIFSDLETDETITVLNSTEAFKFGETSLDTTSSPSATGILAVDSSLNLYLSSGTGAGAWPHVGVNRIKKYIYLGNPSVVSVSTARYTADATSHLFGVASFDANVSSPSNYCRFYNLVVPLDLDPSVDIILRTFKVQLHAADVSSHTYVASVLNIGNSEQMDGTFGDSVTFTVEADASGADGDVEEKEDVTLTGWAAALTPGDAYAIEIARDGDHAYDVSNSSTSFRGMALEYQTR